MKLLPVYLNCVLKSDVLQPGADVSLDDRAYLRQLLSCMDVSESHIFFYPRLLPLVRDPALQLALFLSLEFTSISLIWHDKAPSYFAEANM